MRNLSALATGAALTGTLVIALAVPTTATFNGTVIRYVATNPQNTDINVGEDPGEEKLSPGDRQIFRNDAVRDGKQIGYELGEALIIEVTGDGDEPTGLKGTLDTTLILTNGTITLRGVLVEDFAQGPVGFTAAVTGGTGRYKGASGQATGEFIPNTDDVKMTIRLQ